MALSAKLELRQGQQLVMTPQLQQAIKLLQLSNMELNAFVETELERNPLLERGEEAGVPAASGVDRAEPEPAASLSDGSLDLVASVATASADLDADHASVDPDAGPGDFRPDLSGGSWSTVRSGSGLSDEDSNLESYVASEVSLKDHLTTQLNHAFQGPAERLIGGYLIDLVDEAGYLRADLAELAEKLGTSSSHVERVLATMQTFSPAGIFARDLKECLALQLKEQGRFDPMIAALIDNLAMLAQHNLAALRRVIGCDAEDLADMIAEIRRLNPKPGLEFGSVEVSPVVPDVIVRPASDGSWMVELNNDTLPRVLVNQQYYTRVSRTARNDKDKEFLIDCLQTANWLVKSLDQRARKILRVAEEIVRQQDGFLTHGVQHMRPLNLKTIADAIKMHESTVSRVTSNKYMATPRGILELKYFFTSAIQSAGDGEAHSSESVRHRIKSLIDGERPSAILSDDKLVEILGKEGIEIARRTVAKYREAMRIPSSVQRRREKRALASEAAE